MSKTRRAAVISHRKDADGISSAALVRFFSGADVFLADYSDLTETLASVPVVEDVYVCDLGLNKSTFDGFLQQVARLRKGGEVHYIDHHPIHPNYASQLRSIGVNLYHAVDECASVLLFKKYFEKLNNSSRMKILACAGAITDYMDLQPYAKKLIASFDRQFLLYESTVLSFCIGTIGRGSSGANSALIDIVYQLADEKLPHEIPDASTLAQEYAKRSAELLTRLRREGKIRKNYAYFLTKESSTGNVANFLMGLFETPVGVALREEEPGYFEISLRSSDESKQDLGKIVTLIATRLNTSGGGHPHASGIRIKDEQLDEFLQILDEELSKQP
ncbi:MAG TPA: DHH family phosphoesterase [Nitrososphaerales archaeon]|nr:DHH family phosphoesterase [Nitrososphaerales archaeon]